MVSIRTCNVLGKIEKALSLCKTCSFPCYERSLVIVSYVVRLTPFYAVESFLFFVVCRFCLSSGPCARAGPTHDWSAGERTERDAKNVTEYPDYAEKVPPDEKDLFVPSRTGSTGSLATLVSSLEDNKKLGELRSLEAVSQWQRRNLCLYLWATPSHCPARRQNPSPFPPRS